MRSAVVVTVLVASAAAQRPRQAPPPPQPSGSGSANSVPPPPPNGTATAVNVSGPPTFPISIASTNPTAIPLSSILATLPMTATTIPLPTTFGAGSLPTAVSGAPPLPDISTLNPANYPPLDRPPPTDSPEVQQWVQELSNFEFPNFSPTQVGGCPTNLEAASDPTRCWWTCGQCFQSTDIVTCPDKLTWGSSFDDGPAPYTPNLLSYLDEQNLKTTFFVVGSRVISRPDYLRVQYMKGHQIAVHTWSHFPLTTLSNEQIIAEFGWSKKVIKDVLGVQPIYMRPPFGDIDDRVRAIAAAMNLTPVIWTSGKASNGVSFDTGDFNIEAGTISASGVINNFTNILKNATTINSGFIVLEHDLFQQSVEIATGYVLPEAIAMKLSIQPIVSCQHMPLSNAYLETNDNSSNPLPTGVGGTPLATKSADSSGDASGGNGGSGGSGKGSNDALKSIGVGVLGSLLAALVGSLTVLC